MFAIAHLSAPDLVFKSLDVAASQGKIFAVAADAFSADAFSAIADTKEKPT